MGEKEGEREKEREKIFALFERKEEKEDLQRHNQTLGSRIK